MPVCRHSRKWSLCTIEAMGTWLGLGLGLGLGLEIGGGLGVRVRLRLRVRKPRFITERPPSRPAAIEISERLGATYAESRSSKAMPGDGWG